MTALHGPIATADALQTLKPLGRYYQRFVLRQEIGKRVFGHVTDVRACTHRVKGRTPERLWKCVADSDNTRTPGCGALFAVAYSQHGQPTWTPAEKCSRCGDTGIEPGSEDYDYTVHMYNPSTGEPCTACQGGVR